MVLKPEQERVRTLLNDTITLLCKNGLNYKVEFNINALIGITLDREEVFLIDIRETIKNAETAADQHAAPASSNTNTDSSNKAHRKRRKNTNQENSHDTSESEGESDSGSTRKGAKTSKSKSNGPRHETSVDSMEPPSKRSIKQELYEAQHQEEESNVLIVKPEPGYRQRATCDMPSSSVSQSSSMQPNNITQPPTFSSAPGQPPMWDQNASVANTAQGNLAHTQQTGCVLPSIGSFTSPLKFDNLPTTTDLTREVSPFDLNFTADLSVLNLPVSLQPPGSSDTSDSFPELSMPDLASVTGSLDMPPKLPLIIEPHAAMDSGGSPSGTGVSLADYDADQLKALGPDALMHQFAHHKDGSYRCPICQKVIKNRGGLKPHINVHLGIYRYMCHHCGKGMSSITPLKEHLMQAHGEKGWHCRMCQMEFESYKVLKSHISETHGTVLLQQGSELLDT